MAKGAAGKYSVFYDASENGDTLPPITISCANCERIVADSTHFSGASRQMHTITLDSVVSVSVDSPLQTCEEGAWDEFCNYKRLLCGKCGSALGKQYFATTNKLVKLQGKYTLEISALTFYFHGSNVPTLPVAESQEILSLLRPEPDQMADTMARVMMLCVVLREEQEGIMRALQKVSEQTGVDISLDGSEENQSPRKEKVGLAEKIEELVAAVERLKDEFVVKSELEALKEEVGDRSGSKGIETDRATTRDRETYASERNTPIEETQPEQEEDEEYVEEVVHPKKKRKGSQFVVDVSEVPDSQPPGRHNTGGRRTSGRAGRNLK